MGELTDDGDVLALVGGDDPGEQLDAGERWHGDLGEDEVEGVGARPHDLPRLHPVRDRGHCGSLPEREREVERDTSESSPNLVGCCTKQAAARGEGKGGKEGRKGVALTAVAALAEERGDDLARGVVVLDEEDTEGAAREDLVPPHHRPPVRRRRRRGGGRRAASNPAAPGTAAWCAGAGDRGVGVGRHPIGGERGQRGRGPSSSSRRRRKGAEGGGRGRRSERWGKYLQFFSRWVPRQRRGGEIIAAKGKRRREEKRGRGVAAEMARQQIPPLQQQQQHERNKRAGDICFSGRRGPCSVRWINRGGRYFGARILF